MKERMEALKNYLVSSIRLSERLSDLAHFNPHNTWNVNSEIFQLHREMCEAYKKYKEEVIESLKPKQEEAPAPVAEPQSGSEAVKDPVPDSPPYTEEIHVPIPEGMKVEDGSLIKPLSIEEVEQSAASEAVPQSSEVKSGE